MEEGFPLFGAIVLALIVLPFALEGRVPKWVYEPVAWISMAIMWLGIAAPIVGLPVLLWLWLGGYL